MIKIFLQTHRPGTKLYESWTCIVYGGGNCKMKMSYAEAGFESGTVTRSRFMTCAAPKLSVIQLAEYVVNA